MKLLEISFRNVFLLALALLLFMATGAVFAASNIGRANIGADPDPGDVDYVTDSATLTLTSTTLSVAKLAFLNDATGTQITSGSSVVKGSIVKFMIYIDNSTSTQASDVRLEDLLNDTDFTYQAGTLSWNNNVTNTATAVATIFANTDRDGANTGVALTDAISGADVASMDTTASPDRITMGAHSAQANGTLNIPAGKIAAFIFKARVN